MTMTSAMLRYCLEDVDAETLRDNMEHCFDALMRNPVPPDGGYRTRAPRHRGVRPKSKLEPGLSLATQLAVFARALEIVEGRGYETESQRSGT